MNRVPEWKRFEAEQRIVDVFEEAKAHGLQKVTDQDGVFEIKFIPGVSKEPIGKMLARGGPDAD